MRGLSFSLLGRFDARCGDTPITGLHAKKTQELVAYLLLSKGRAQSRERLAEVLWQDAGCLQSRKYLRQAVWQLQGALEAAAPGAVDQLIAVDRDWIQLAPCAQTSSDVSDLEEAHAQVGDPGTPIGNATARRLHAAAELYKGDLLDGCYADWCVFERDRFRRMYLGILERLVEFSDQTGRCELGVMYCTLVLRLERAHERTHRQMMRLLYRLGDRTAALRQYERCREALEDELGVQPAEATVSVYADLRSDQCPRGEEPVVAEVHAIGRGRKELLRARRALDDVRELIDAGIGTLETEGSRQA